MNTKAVTVRQLLELDVLDRYEVLGGHRGLKRPVRAVVVGSVVREISQVTPGSVVVFGREQLEIVSPTVDFVIRLAAGAGVVGIIADLTSPEQVPLASRRLADRMAMPLVGVEDVNPARIVAAFDPYVRAPEIAGLRVLGDAARVFQRPPANAHTLASLLTTSLGEQVAIVDAESRFIAGDRRVLTMLGSPGPLEGLTSPHPIALTVKTDDGDVLLQPVQVDPSGPAHYWIAVRRPGFAAGTLLEPVRHVIAIAALSFALSVAGETIQIEREHRRKSLVLNEILEQGHDPSPGTVKRATALGWRLAGWHVAVEVRVQSGQLSSIRPSVLGIEIEESLAGQSLDGPLVERDEGWLHWTTAENETSVTDNDVITDRLVSVLAGVEAEHPGLRLCAGVGRAYAGTLGINRSAEEARRAVLLAETAHRPSAVEHIDTGTTERLLVGWYSSPPIRAAATDLLAPVLDADSSGELLLTLRCYLDFQSSAKSAGRILGVHRNTVMQRMSRVAQLLSVDLDDPEIRLAVHMAARTLDVDRDRSS